MTIERLHGNGYGGGLNFLSTNPPVGADDYIGFIKFQAKYSGTAYTGAMIFANSMNALDASHQDTRLDFQTTTGTTLSTKMTILGGGNVGVGLMSPTAKIEIQGAGNTSSTYPFIVKNSDGSTIICQVSQGCL